MRELDFLEIIKNTLSKNSFIGDDCAWLKDLGIVITQDSLVEDIHFSLEFSTPYQLAYKSMIVNLSDILASGAVPKYMTVSLSIPNYLDNSFVSEFYKACNDLSEEFGFEIIGGDITGSAKLFISICAIGLTNGRKISSRKNAQVGDYVVTTGVHGSSAAGLFLLMKNGKWKMENEEKEIGNRKWVIESDFAEQNRLDSRFTVHASLIKVHLMPTIAKDFSEEISTKINRDYAMMDTSDGLVDALFKIAQASNVQISVDFNKIPYDKEIEEIAQKANIDFKDWIFYGGEDYQLIACINKENLDKLSSPYTIIGQVKKKENNHFVEIIYDNEIQKISNLEKTFNHFKDSP